MMHRSKWNARLTDDVILKAADRFVMCIDSPAFCLACGNEQEGCPVGYYKLDGYTHECKACGEPQVFGAPELAQNLLSLNLWNSSHPIGKGKSAMMSDTDSARMAADLAGITAACEDAFAAASRETYVDHPAVIPAVAALKTAHAELVLADANFRAAKGFLRVMAAVWRSDRANRAARTAYVRLRAAISQAGDDNLRKMGFSEDWISTAKDLLQK